MKIVRVVLLVLAAGFAVSAQEQTRRIDVTALDSGGNPVTDLAAADFTITESGNVRPVVRVQPATAMMQIAISASVRRNDLTLRAPTHVPDKL
ncbi:MAG TPA: hypothetical protein VNR64_15290 [Vicinamibacterales bacterium]|nr:hypothetical protein [Vicinamibacterales bacterium]